MNAADAQRLSEIKQHRLLLPAVELDDTLVRFTEPKWRRKLEHHLAIVSVRSIPVDPGDMIDGSSVTRNRLSAAREKVDTLNGKPPTPHSFLIDKEARILVRKNNSERRIYGIDFKVHMGNIATSDGAQIRPALLRPELWSRSALEQRLDREAGRASPPTTIPPDERLDSDIVTMRYVVPYPMDKDPIQQARHLKGILSAGVRLYGLRLEPHKLGITPILHGVFDPPRRSEDLLAGAEQYAVDLDQARHNNDNNPQLEDAS